MDESKYKAKATINNPALLIFLIDQSTSMERILTEDKNHNSYSISRIVKIMVDNVLYQILRKNTEGATFKEKIQIAIIGYGLTVHSAIYEVNLEEYPIGVNRIDEVAQKSDPPPSPDELFPRSKLSWVEERSDGLTPMLAAFEEAKKILEKWIPSHKSSNPPIVVNITDGIPTDDAVYAEMFEQGFIGDLSKTLLVSKAEEIKKLETDFGNVLIANGHITAEKITEVQYPVSASEVERVDPLALIFFQMSSIIPEPFRTLGNDPESFDMNLKYNAKMLLYNANVASILNFIEFGSTVGGNT